MEATWATYQRLIDAYRDPDRKAGKVALTDIIAALNELRKLGRTLNKRAADILTYFDRPGTSNGLTEAMAGSNTSAASH